MGLKEIFNAVLEFDGDSVVKLVKKEIEQGTDISLILNDGLIGAMDEVGKLFSSGELFVPEMLLAAQTMKEGLNLLKPYMTQSNSKTKGTVVIGTVKGDLHDIGKNLVAMMMEGAGFEVIDLGVDVPFDKFIEVAQEKKADIICMSALLTTTMPEMEVTIKAVREQGLAYKTMIGGAPVTQDFAEKIGADAYSDDAPGAVVKARQLLAS